jgi:hypothetical protein
VNVSPQQAQANALANPLNTTNGTTINGATAINSNVASTTQVVVPVPGSGFPPGFVGAGEPPGDTSTLSSPAGPRVGTGPDVGTGPSVGTGPNVGSGPTVGTGANVGSGPGFDGGT